MLRVLSYIVDGRLGDRMPESTQWAVRAVEEGVDVISGQGTGMDAGPYYLGSDEVLSLRRKDIEPLLMAAKRTGTPFVFSMGGAGGADHHLENYLQSIREIARDNGTTFRVAKLSGEVSSDYLRQKIRDGVKIRRSIDTPRVSEYLSEEDVDAAVRIQTQMGPEPIARALGEDGIDGVITGRALDVGVHMASPLSNGVPRSTAAHLAKVVECSSMCAEPTTPFEGVIAEVDGDSFTVRPTHPDYRCTVRSVSGHSLYERENPFEERNPGGVLDVGQARYEQVDDRTVHCSGGIWREAPYTIKLEGAALLGYQAATICAIRDSAMIESLDAVLDSVRTAIETVAGGEEVNIAFHVIGRDAVLGQSEPLRETAKPHEVGVLLVVTAPTPELAQQLVTTGRLRLFMADFPGRRSTAGNTAVPLQKTAFPLDRAYVFNIWHLLPLDDPCEPFRHEVLELG
ncbi:MAG: acyclic terpene utilization AtuA family protein [Thermoleophilaceae bacterium]